MASISSLGIGSGVLNQDLVDQLVAAERKPTQQRLDFRAAKNEALISAYGKLKSAVTELRLPMRMLGSADTMKAFSATSSEDNLTATVDSTKASAGTYDINVTSKAKSHALASRDTFDDRDATSVGQGTLTITVGDKTTDVTIDDSNDTLEGLAKAINDADAGVSASIVDTGNGYRLTLSSESTGTANAMEITAADDDGNNTDGSGLSRFAFNSGMDPGAGLEETVAAQDAVLEINGISVTRSSNTIENVVDGLTLEISDVGSSTVTVSQDTAAVADRVQGFVDKYNELQRVIDSMTAFDAEQGQGSLLTGDTTVRNIQTQLRRALGEVVPGLENANVRTLADVGITTDFETGELLFDSTKFQDQLKDNPDDVTALFAEQGRTSDSQVEFVQSGSNTKPGEYAINVTQIAERGGMTSNTATPANVTVTASNNSISFSVDGETRVDIELTEGGYTRAELADEIQKQLSDNSAMKSSGRSVTVSVEADGKLTFTSGKYGSSSNVSIIAVDTDTETDLGLAEQTGVIGKDVKGSINGVTAEGDGQVLFLESDVGGGAAGIQLRITGGGVGDRGTVKFIEGVSDRVVNAINDFVGTDGTIAARTDNLNNDMQRIQDDRERLDQRIESYRERLIKQFTAADTRISELNSTLEFVTQQLAALAPKSSKD